MPGRLAARVGDMTVHGSPLSPGPGSPNVFIANQKAWRGITAAQATQLAQEVKKVTKALARYTAVSGTPKAPDELRKLAEAVVSIGSLMQSFSADIHSCPVMKGPVADGVGVVIDGSQTVFINNLAACRINDTIQEATSVNKITQGEPTVLIGG